MSAGAGRDVSCTWGGSNIEGMREKQIQLGGDPIDITSDDDAGHQKLLKTRTRKAVTITASGVRKSDSLMADWFNDDTEKTLVWTYEDGSSVSGTFILANYSNTGPYEDAVTFDCTFMSSGETSFSPAV